MLRCDKHGAMFCSSIMLGKSLFDTIGYEIGGINLPMQTLQLTINEVNNHKRSKFARLNQSKPKRISIYLCTSQFLGTEIKFTELSKFDFNEIGWIAFTSILGLIMLSSLLIKTNISV